MADNRCTWTVTIVVMHDGVHDHVYDELEQAILQQELTGRIRYVIYYYFLHEGLVHIKELIFHNNFQQLETIDSYHSDLYDPQTLLRFFTQTIGPDLHLVQDHRHMVILNGHGAGLGFFAGRRNDGSLRMITAEQLAALFRQSIGKADVLLAVSCYTQLLETGYSLKDVVDLFIAPQTTMTYYGFHYAKLFNLLETTPCAGLQEIADNVTDNFLLKYNEEPFRSTELTRYADEQNPNLVCIAANYLKEYDAIVDCVNELTDFLMQSFEPGKEWLLDAVIRARRSCTELTPSRSFGFIDLSFFIEQLLNEAGPVQPLQDIHQRFHLVRKRCIASLHKPPGPPDLYAVSIRKRVRSTMSPLFLSIFFPAFSITADQLAIREIYFSDDGRLHLFRSRCRWELFIRTIFNRT
ncbi:MAG TPA: clostripain-related cysteine peptidase [Pseudobacter sp.]|nr:clostripain-related cysteine peptidase [Pseudobacter sp.]